MHVVKCQLKNIQVYFTFGNFLKGSESAGYAFDECLMERNAKVYFFCLQGVVWDLTLNKIDLSLYLSSGLKW